METNIILDNDPYDLFAKRGFLMQNSGGSSFLEIFNRRSTWTRGMPVNLADGSLWRLSAITNSLMITTPSLRRDIDEVFRLARVISAQSQTDETPSYHAQLMTVGLGLLRANYELTDQKWMTLIEFESNEKVFVITYQVASVLNLARPVVQPFLTPSSLNPPLAILRN